MVVYEIFTHPELRRCKAAIPSKATVLSIAGFLMTATLPIISGSMYRSGGFWIKESAFQKSSVVALPVITASLINQTSSFVEEYRKYNKRNVTTRLADLVIEWTLGPPFTLQASITYPAEETIRFRPGYWNLIKCLSVLVVFLYILQRVKVFGFSNQLVPTIVEQDSDSKHKLMQITTQ